MDYRDFTEAGRDWPAFLVETDYGTVAVDLHDGPNRYWIRTLRHDEAKTLGYDTADGGYTPDLPVIINRVEYAGRASVVRVGSELDTNPHAPKAGGFTYSGSRVDHSLTRQGRMLTYQESHPTDAARAAWIRLAERIASELDARHPDAKHRAAHYAATYDLERCIGEIDDAQRLIDRLEDKAGGLRLLRAEHEAKIGNTTEAPR